MRTRCLHLFLVLALALVAPLGNAVVQAQPSPLAGAQRATRAELTAKVATLEQQLASGALSRPKAEQARKEVAAIRQRLEKGDFRPGDRFVVTVRQDGQKSDTATVRDSLLVALVGLPDASVAGVLRSELDEKLTAHIGRYLRNVEVRSLVLTRIAILGGGVPSPGFYYSAPDRPLGDILMLAGGPVPEADLQKIQISRGAVPVLKDKAARSALETGLTLEQLDVQSGDEIRVPLKRKFPWGSFFRILIGLSTLIFAALQFLQWYINRQDN